jgi:YVTN family beta-propeller protein
LKILFSDSSTNTVIDTIDVGKYPISIKFNPSNNNIYVANFNSTLVSVIDSSTNTVVDTVEPQIIIDIQNGSSLLII